MTEIMVRGMDYWREVWANNDLSFHYFEVNKMLKKHIILLNPDGKKLKILVPLCGKTLDMKWLYDQGHTVVGVEGVRKGLEDFYTEHKLERIEEDAPSMGPDCKLLQHKDGKLKTFFGDIFLFNKSVDGQFDCVWDRGCIVSLDRPDLKKYAEVLIEVTKPGGKIFVELYEYDMALIKGLSKIPPPHPMFEDELKSLFEPDCTVELVDKDKRLLDGKEFDLRYYLIVKK